MNRPINPTPKDIERFWSKVDIRSDGECWNWKAGKFTEGYGEFHINHVVLRANRVAYVISHGTIPNDFHVHHICSNKGCCNPNHLQALTRSEHEIVTSKMNQRAVGTRHWSKTHPKSHKLNQTQADEIRNLRRQGLTQRVIGKLFGVSNITVHDIEHGKTWKK
jgi:DNA-binding transcriptional regulator YiaG